MKVFIIIPAYNEKATIQTVVRQALQYSKNIVVVDDGSKDTTQEEARKTGATVLRHVINLGKGAALKTGCEYATKEGAHALILMDADGQHSPKMIPQFIEKLKENDIVFGVRKINTRKMPLLRRIGNYGLNSITRTLFKIKVDDALCGYRALTAETYRKIKWNSAGYEVEVEMIANTGKHHLKTIQLPIETIYSDAYKGMTIFDGIRVGISMLWWKLTK